MSADRLRGYRFATEAQWGACLFAMADRSPDATAGLRPLEPFRPSMPPLAASEPHALSIDRFSALRWVDDNGRAYRLLATDEPPESFVAPATVAKARRIVANRGGLWALHDGGLDRFDAETLVRLACVEGSPVEVRDMASDGRDGVYLLTRDAQGQVLHLDRQGRLQGRVKFDDLDKPTAFAWLGQPRRFVVLDERGYLRWFAQAGGAELARVMVGGLHPCFVPGPLAGDGRERVFLALRDPPQFGARAYLLAFDGDGNALGEIPLPRPAIAMAARRGILWIATREALHRYSAAQVVPDHAGEVKCEVLTPALESGEHVEGRRWLRVDAATRLPPGATLEIRWAATNDAAVRDAVREISRNPGETQPRRLRRVLEHPLLEWKRAVVVHGAEAISGEGAPLSAPLHEVPKRFLWVHLTLSAAAGARLPSLLRIAVLYPERSLIDELPAVYQRADVQPDSALRRPGTGNEDFLRALVGVLEATTQDLDERIASLAGRLDAAGAPEPWLDFLASWLGVPWDEALAVAQKRCILAHAANLAAARGTRAGLERLLGCLFPEEPRRFRVTDATADLGFATVGVSALPAMLGGRTSWSAELGLRSVLGRMRLPCESSFDDGAWQLAGRVRVEIAADAGERSASQPWITAVLGAMVPMTARLQVRWTGLDALASGRLDGDTRLDARPAGRLGGGAITGMTRLPPGESRLSATGPATGARLH